MKRASWIPMFFLVVACSDPKGPTTGGNLGETGGEAEDSDDSAEDTGGKGDTGGPPPVTTGVVTTLPPDGDDGASEDGSSDEGDAGGCNFICLDDVNDGGECDHWAQDCLAGEKCSAYADNGGSSWNNTKCVPVKENADQPGDECTVDGNGVSGFDSCDKGAMCWGVNPDTGKGVCVELCKGTAEAPVCDPGFQCAIANNVLNLCLPSCDPLSQDCAGDDLCIPNGEAFLCVLDASGDEGQAFDPCQYANACDKGLYCMDPVYASECDPNGGGCCLPFCDTKAPDCPGAGQQCLPWYEGTAPPGYEKVGICGLPM